MSQHSRIKTLIAAVAAAAVVLVGGLAAAASGAPATVPAVPRFTHVVEVFLENESATTTFEDPSAAPALAALRKTGLYIPQFYAAGHASLDNYEAAFSAEQPTAAGKADCLGMLYGSCIFPASVPTLATLLDPAGLSWKVYSEGMDGAPLGHNCLHALSPSLPDFYQGLLTNGYATRHNPAPWFASILDKGTNESYCQAHNVDLKQLTTDLTSGSRLPAFSFIEPDTCHDGHDNQTGTSFGCLLDPEGLLYPSGIKAIDAWLPGFVHQVVTSKAWDAHSLLLITFDEGATSDTSGCPSCHDTSAGGRVGALAISPMVTAGATATWQGDHYAFLRTLEAGWGLPTLKSIAKTATAAKTVHDGDPGVTPLTGVWTHP
jgi:hypothetical protein